jgi:hypothetical protein
MLIKSQSKHVLIGRFECNSLFRNSRLHKSLPLNVYHNTKNYTQTLITLQGYFPYPFPLYFPIPHPRQKKSHPAPYRHSVTQPRFTQICPALPSPFPTLFIVRVFTDG